MGIVIDDENNFIYVDVIFSLSFIVICNKYVLECLIVEMIVVFSS